MVKPEKFDHFHLVYHFTVPLTDKVKSIQLSVHELSYLKGSHKNQFLVPYSLFNIYINDIFFALKGNNICNFADDTQLT